MRSLRLSIVAMLVSAGACVVQPGPAPGTTVPPPERTHPEGPSEGILYGVVVDAQTHAPLAKVGLDFAMGGKAVGTAVTDTDGRYQTPALPPGDYAVRIRREQYNYIQAPHVSVPPGRTEMNFEMTRHP